MLAEAFRQPGERMPIAGLGLIGLVGAAIASAVAVEQRCPQLGRHPVGQLRALHQPRPLHHRHADDVVFGRRDRARAAFRPGEYYALTLFAICGMMMMAAATDLLVIFLALEILSLAVYVLTGIRRSSAAGAEAAFKYFLLGAFSSAFFLYGVAFTFALSGSTRIEDIGTALSAQASGPPSTVALLAVGLLAVGFAFKVSAVPFHMWTPDAYEGAPTIVTAFMSTGVKAAAFAAFARVFLSPLEPLQATVDPGAVGRSPRLTMIVGTVVGVVQTNVKRMLAYSSIAHAGYLLLGIVVGEQRRQGRHPLLSAGVRRHQHRRARHRRAARHRAEPARRAPRFRGLWRSRPALAGLMTVFLLSLGGIPPTAGFIGKWYIFSAAIQEGHYWLAIIGVLTSVVSVFFYLRIVVMMYMTEGPETRPAARSRCRDGRPRAGGHRRVLSRHPADARPRSGARVDLDDLLTDAG